MCIVFFSQKEFKMTQKLFVSRKILSAGLLALLSFTANVSGQGAIPDSIQLAEETPVQSRFSVPVSDRNVVPAQYAGVTPVQTQGPLAPPSAPLAPSDPTVYEAAPNYPADPQAGIPAYTPDGSFPAESTPVMEGTPVMDEYAGMPMPCDGLFLSDFCAPYCAPCGGGILGPGCLFVEGYIAQGFNVSSNSSTNGEPMAVNDREGYQMNQAYLSFGRHVMKGSQWSIGGRIDVMFGTDYYYMTAAGLETDTDNQPHWNSMGDDPGFRASRSLYGMALPQAYGEIYAPILRGVDVKIGHFHSVMGFESNQANQNFFYSRSYTSVYGMPTSMTGVMTDWKITDSLSIIAGAVNEWNAFDTPEDHFSFVVGAAYENLCGNFALSALVMSGKQSAAAFQANGHDEGANSTVVDVFAKFKLTDRLAYVAEFNYGTNDAEVYDILDDSTFKGRNWYGFSNYLFYCMSDTLTLGARFEWFCDKENTAVTGGQNTTFANVGVNYFSWTFGANWDPCPWLTVRPEMRWDYCDLELDVDGETFYAYDRNSANYQFTVSCDAVIRF